MKRTRRAGLSLLEVMLATTVLLGSVIVLSQIAFVGTAHMDAARQYAAAQLVCQARMNEMLAGALPIEELSGQAIPELPGWGLSVKVESAGQPGLLAIEVTAAEGTVAEISQLATETVSPDSAEVTTSDFSSDVLHEPTQPPIAAPQQEVGTGKRFTLVRWIAEPEDSELSRSVFASGSSPPVDLPVEGSSFDDSMLPDEPFVPEEPSLFDEPLPEF